jgi:hypothetical protein
MLDMDEMTRSGDWIAYVMMLSVPAYFVLQLWLGHAWTGIWRWVALFPLVFTLPALAWTISAASHGANLAPMPMLLAAPPALLYLLIAWVLRQAMRRLTAT